MAKRRIIDDALYAHFVTFNVYRRRRLLELDHPKRICLGVLNTQLESYRAKCIGFVIMPDHVHAIIWLPETGRLSTFIHGWKRMSSFHIRRWYRTSAPSYVRDFGEGDQFWQQKYHAFEINDRRKTEEKLIYMHQNPERVGLVEHAIDWNWSSARWYHNKTPVGVPIEWLEKGSHPLSQIKG